ncbi:hypothetical protein TSMEX_007406 [Taenia solium]|eukprot:TsM_001056500 transcript=TsM_001056500 gene=TsM_001056500
MGLWMPREVYVTVENTSGVPGVFACKLDYSQSREQVSLDSAIFQHENWQTQNAKAHELCRRLLKPKQAFAISINPSSSAIKLLAHGTVTVCLIGCADIFGEFHDTLTISVVPLRKCETEPRTLIARLPVIARAYGSPVDFLTATKSINKKAFNECLRSKVMDAKFSELLLSSIPARETTLSELIGISTVVGMEKTNDFSIFAPSITFMKNHHYSFNPILEAKPFISLLIRPHEGYAVSRSHTTACRLIEPTGIDESGITLFPLQSIIPPHREASTFVSIDGRIASLQKVEKIEAYAQGFISIEEAGDNVRLPEPLLLPQLRLNLKATAMQPVVTLEYGDEMDTPVRLLPCELEHPPKPFQITLRAEDFILSSSQFSSTQRKSSQRHADEDQLLILEYSKSPSSSRHLANRVWCLRRLIVRNLSPYPVAVQAEASEGEIYFKEDIQVRAEHCRHVIEILDSLQAKDPLPSKKQLKVAAKNKQSVR